MGERAEIEQTHCVVAKVFAFSVPPLDKADGFKASLWPKQPIWVGRLRVVSRADKCAVLLEHTDKDGLFASCPIQNERTVESAVDSSRYFVLRLSDGKGRHALIGIGFNDRAQAFDFKVALQDWQNHNADPSPPPAAAGHSSSGAAAASNADYSIPQGGSIHVTFGSGGKKKRNSIGGGSAADVSQALAGMKLDGPAGADSKEKKKKKKKDKESAPDVLSGFGDLSAASSVVNSSSSSSSSRPAPAPVAANPNIIDFGFGDFDPLSTPKQKAPVAGAADPFADAPRRASVVDPFAAQAAAQAFATPFDTPFDDTPADWVKF